MWYFFFAKRKSRRHTDFSNISQRVVNKPIFFKWKWRATRAMAWRVDKKRRVRPFRQIWDCASRWVDTICLIVTIIDVKRAFISINARIIDSTCETVFAHTFDCGQRRAFFVVGANRVLTRVRHDKTTTKDNDYDKTWHATRQDNDNKLWKNKWQQQDSDNNFFRIEW